MLVLCVLNGACWAQERSQARAMVISRQGIVATSQTLASVAGVRMLDRGGSAVDAAIAANLVLGVVEPMMCGLGGDLFTLYWEAASKKLHGLNASGWSPKALTLDGLRKAGKYGVNGIDTVTVPGAVDGFARIHKRFGKLPWKDLFAPAIHYARHGFPVTEIIQWDWDHTASKLMADANARRIFLPDGRAPEVGGLFRNPELAGALEAIANGGPDAFYKGPVGRAILATSQRLGGSLSAADFAEFASEWVEPIRTNYRGWEVHEIPPSTQGIGVLQMLNVMERFPLGEHAALSTQAYHLKIEAQKLAYSDMTRYVADPKAASVPVAGLLSKTYAAERAKLVNPEKANCGVEAGVPPGASGNTIYLSVVDKEGNMVSWIQSISDLWGSGIVVDGMGFHLHDRGHGFETDSRHPNALAPRKRPFHTIIPGFMRKGALQTAFGIMRGMNQAQAHAQFVSNVVDHGMNIQAALEAPRFTRRGGSGCDVLIESRVPGAVRDALTEMGHWLDVRGEYSGLMGGGQAVSRDLAAGVNYGASSPRKDGAAVPQADPY